MPTIGHPPPQLIAQAGQRAVARFVELFADRISNRNTSAAYFTSLSEFSRWCCERGFGLSSITEDCVAKYLRQVQDLGSHATARLRLSALNAVFDWLVTGRIIAVNPASAVRIYRPRRRSPSKPTPDCANVGKLLNSINTSHPIGLRDRALIGVIFFAFVPASTVVSIRQDDYYDTESGKILRLRRGRRVRVVPVHPKLADFLDEYLRVLPSTHGRVKALFRSARGRSIDLTNHRLTRTDALRMIKRRATAAGPTDDISCRNLRAAGLEMFFAMNGSVQAAQLIAGHASIASVLAYSTGHTAKPLLEEIERVAI